MKTKEIRTLLNEHFESDDDPGRVSFYNGRWTVREGFSYRHGRSERDLVKRILGVLPEAEVIGSGEHYTRFKGRPSVVDGSYWWVTFTV